MRSENYPLIDVYTKYEIGLKTLLNRLEERLAESDPQYLEAVKSHGEIAHQNAKFHPLYGNALTYQQRLMENIEKTRYDGDNETRRSERAEIISQLNRLAATALNVDFNSLCSRGPHVFAVLGHLLARYWWIVVVAAVLLILPLANKWLAPYQEPQFTIVALNTLVDDPNAYELTDMLIQSCTKAEKEKHGVDITFSIEIRPRYYGLQHQGRVIAIVSGDGTASKEYALWDDFAQDASTQQITLTLEELVTISGLKQNSDPAVNRLDPEHYDFEQAILRIQIAQEAQKTHPWHSENITIRNTPWQETASLVYRQEQHEVGVYVKNFGGKGDFTIRYHWERLSRLVKSEIGGGTENYPHELIHLEAGKSCTVTFPLPEEVGYGRYFLEVYAVKKQNYVRFTDAQARWDNLNSLECPWCFGGSPTYEFYFETEPTVADVVKKERERLEEADFDLGVALEEAESVVSCRGTEGERQIFENGEVYVHHGQAYALYGPILEHYHKLEGYKHNRIGFPISTMQTITSTLGTQASMMSFEGIGGQPATFYASGQATAAVWEAFATAYLDTYGGPQGGLGLPLSDECYHRDSSTQKFEGGYMVLLYPVINGERDYTRPPLAYPYLTSQGALLDVRSSSWQDTGIIVHPNDRVSVIQVGGSWTDGGSSPIWFDANGNPREPLTEEAPLPTARIGSLIGKVGNQGEPFLIGRWSKFSIASPGNLYLAMNDASYSTNDGIITVEIVVTPAE